MMMSAMQQFSNWVQTVSPSTAAADRPSSATVSNGTAPVKSQNASRQAEVTKRLGALIGPYKEAVSQNGPIAAQMQSRMDDAKKHIVQRDFEQAAKNLEELGALVEKSKLQNQAGFQRAPDSGAVLIPPDLATPVNKGATAEAGASPVQFFADQAQPAPDGSNSFESLRDGNVRQADGLAEPELPPIEYLKSITVTRERETMEFGEKQQFNASGQFVYEKSGYSKDLTDKVNWKSESESVSFEKNDKNGVATARQPGLAVITATYPGSDVPPGRAGVNVKYPTLVGIAIQNENPRIIGLNGSLQFKAKGRYSDGVWRDFPYLRNEVEWSTNSKRLEIDDDGRATADHADDGAVFTVTAKSGGFKDETSVTITVLIDVLIKPDNPSAQVGDVVPFEATGLYSDHKTRSLINQVKWKSSDESICSIGKYDGKAVPRSPGRATISAAVRSGKNGQTVLTVEPMTLVGIEILPPKLSMVVGDTKEFVAKGTLLGRGPLVGAGDHGPTVAKNLEGVIWNSSAPKVVSIDAKGRAIARGIGKDVKISAKSGNVPGFASVTVTADDPDPNRETEGKPPGNIMAEYELNKGWQKRLREGLLQLTPFQKRFEKGESILDEINLKAPPEAVKFARSAEKSQDTHKALELNLDDYHQQLSDAETAVRLANLAVKKETNEEEAADLRARAKKMEENTKFIFGLLKAAEKALQAIVLKDPKKGVESFVETFESFYERFHENDLVAQAEQLEKEVRGMAIKGARENYALAQGKFEFLKKHLEKVKTLASQVDSHYARDRKDAENTFDQNRQTSFHFAELRKAIDKADEVADLADRNEQGHVEFLQLPDDQLPYSGAGLVMRKNLQTWMEKAVAAAKLAGALRKEWRELREKANAALADKELGGTPRPAK
jgi:hypothetical protein